VQGPVVTEHVRPVDDRCIQDNRIHSIREPRTIQRLQDDRTTHGPPEEDDLTGARVNGIQEGSLTVPPLRKPKAVSAVQTLRGADVVAIHGYQDGEAEVMKHRHRSKTLISLCSSAVDKDCPTSPASTVRHRLQRVSRHLPGREHPELRVDRHVTRRQSQRVLGVAGVVVLVPPGGTDAWLTGVHPLEDPSHAAQLVVHTQNCAHSGMAPTAVEPEPVATRLLRLRCQPQGDAVVLDAQNLRVVWLQPIWGQHPAGKVCCRTDGAGRRQNDRTHARRGGREEAFWINPTN